MTNGRGSDIPESLKKFDCRLIKVLQRDRPVSCVHGEVEKYLIDVQEPTQCVFRKESSHVVPDVARNLDVKHRWLQVGERICPA